MIFLDWLLNRCGYNVSTKIVGIAEQEAAMDVMIVKVGNSRGVRIPKPLIEEAGLGERVSLRVVEEGLLIEPRTEPRQGWAEAARVGRERGEGALDGAWGPTRFDSVEWEWESAEGNS